MVKEYAMWVEEQPNGKFKFRQNYIDPLKSTPDHIVLKKVSVTLTKNTRQAQSKARQLLQEKINKKLKILKSDNSHITIDELFSKYLKRIADALIEVKGYPIKTKYIYGSRKAWRIPSFVNEIDDEFFSEFGNFANIKKYDSLLKAMDITEEDFIRIFPELEYLKSSGRIIESISLS